MQNIAVSHSEIENTRRQLELAARNQIYNFTHPEVLALSQKLDALIIQAMKEKPARS